MKLCALRRTDWLDKDVPIPFVVDGILSQSFNACLIVCSTCALVDDMLSPSGV